MNLAGRTVHVVNAVVWDDDGNEVGRRSYTYQNPSRLMRDHYYDYRKLHSTERAMNEYKIYRRKNLAEIRSYIPGEDMTGISVAAVDSASGSPKDGDMIARNPDNHNDQWLLAKRYFEDNFEPVHDGPR